MSCSTGSILRLVCVSLLCLCVFMQLLGVPVTMWNLQHMQLEEDLSQGSILTQVSIPAGQDRLNFGGRGSARSDISQVVRDMLLEGLLFRPPCLLT